MLPYRRMTGVGGHSSPKPHRASPIANTPAFNVTPHRMIADGKFVVLQSTFNGFGPTPMIAFDVFRIDGDKIVEHWDALAPAVAPNPSGHTETDGPTDIAELDKTDANKALVGEFYNTVLVGGKFDLLGKYIDGESYIQHNPNAADGLSGLAKAMEAMAKQGINMQFTKVHKVIGEGNMVLVQAEGALGGKPVAYYDLFRVANGKIVEHWDVIQPIPTGDMVKNQNSMF